MRGSLPKCWKILTPPERKKGLVLLALMIAAAFVDVVGVGAVAPFLSILADPESIHGDGFIARLFALSGARDATQFLVMLGVAIAAILVITSIFRAAVMWTQTSFVNRRRHTLSMRLLGGHLAQPYEFFLLHNTAELSKTILGEVEAFITDVLRPGAQLVSYGLLMIAMIGLIVAIDPVSGLMLMGTVGVMYYAVWHFSRRWLGTIGGQRSKMNSIRYKSALEVMAGVKELRINGGEKVYLDKFERSSRRFSKVIAQSQHLQLLPRYLMQSFAFAGIIGVVIWMLLRGDQLEQILPTIGIYAFAGYRLLPALQNVYQSASQLRFGEAAADAVLAELNDLAIEPTQSVAEPMQISRGIELRGIRFAYEGAEQPAFQVEDLVIPANCTLGIVGPTGAGKSTFVDVLLGLLHPQHGEMRVDGLPITDENVRAWQANIGFVPQHIFLADDTVSANIAFGATQIDQARVERAARMAQIHDFITTELPLGYETEIGERGVRLSGGQRQRLGIARALYREPQVLVLDEATSALDSDTETAVMDSVRALSGQRTVIMIAHRTDTLRNCDLVLRIEAGRVSKLGTFDEVVGSERLRMESAATAPPVGPTGDRME